MARAAEQWREQELARHGEAFLEALGSELRADPAAFGLVETSWRAGSRLIDLLEGLGGEGTSALGPLRGTTAEERVDLFVSRFVRRIGGEGGLLTDAVARRAAAHAAEMLLSKHPVLRHAVETDADTVEISIGSDLFCAVYQIFFADLVKEFLAAVIAGKITLMVPILPVLDPAGEITNWLAGQMVHMIPTPCQEKGESDDERSVVELGRHLASDAVLRAFGIAGESE
ncbi:hypothetical protein BAY59_35405 [Prauserella coralliicola]|nr:hypothetical protein BAY59_35405 [Prauserella coralliicola]